MWNNTSSGGFPYFLSSLPSAPYNILYVNWNSGFSPVNGQCGDFAGTTINIYERTRNPQNLAEVQNCNPQGAAQTVAHELGHFLKLEDLGAGTSCPTCIMAQVNGLAHSIQSCESNLADSQNNTASERGGGDECQVTKNCQCAPDDLQCQGSPIIINLSDGPYDLSDFTDPVAFDLNANGRPELTSWTAAEAPMAFLWLDRNSNGMVDDGAELFGNYTPLGGGAAAANGFEALIPFDFNGDGDIDAQDPVWQRLRLWVDRNHNGISETDELVPIADSSVVSISLTYHWTGRQDQWGNTFRYESAVVIRGHNGRLVRRPVYDIYFKRLNF